VCLIQHGVGLDRATQGADVVLYLQLLLRVGEHDCEDQPLEAVRDHLHFDAALIEFEMVDEVAFNPAEHLLHFDYVPIFPAFPHDTLVEIVDQHIQILSVQYSAEAFVQTQFDHARESQGLVIRPTIGGQYLVGLDFHDQTFAQVIDPEVGPVRRTGAPRSQLRVLV